jgi:hypothetical protein
MVQKKCPELIHQRKPMKWQWLQDQRQINGDNLNSARHEVSRRFKNKGREYLVDKINALAIHKKTKNIKDLHKE